MNPAESAQSQASTKRRGPAGRGPLPAPPPRFPLWAPGVAPQRVAYSGSRRAAAHTTSTATLGGRKGRLGTQRGNALAGETRRALTLAEAGAAAGVERRISAHPGPESKPMRGSPPVVATLSTESGTSRERRVVPAPARRDPSG